MISLSARGANKAVLLRMVALLERKSETFVPIERVTGGGNNLSKATGADAHTWFRLAMGISMAPRSEK